VVEEFSRVLEALTDLAQVLTSAQRIFRSHGLTDLPAGHLMAGAWRTSAIFHLKKRD
jgi:hypothetical protein